MTGIASSLMDDPASQAPTEPAAKNAHGSEDPLSRLSREGDYGSGPQSDLYDTTTTWTFLDTLKKWRRACFLAH